MGAWGWWCKRSYLKATLNATQFDSSKRQQRFYGDEFSHEGVQNQA